MRCSQGGGSSGPRPSAARMSPDSCPGRRSANSLLLSSAAARKYLLRAGQGTGVQYRADRRLAATAIEQLSQLSMAADRV